MQTTATLHSRRRRRYCRAWQAVWCSLVVSCSSSISSEHTSTTTATTSSLYKVQERQLLTAVEQVVGPWNLQLRPTYTFLRKPPVLQDLFPPSSSSSNNNIDATATAKATRQKKSCRLDVHPDGTFTLTPPSDHDTAPLHGRWMMQPNPYCVTDRCYDELTLVSYSRQWIAKCRVTGRYSMGAIRRLLGRPHGRCQGKITHGTLLRVAPNSDYKTMRATFTAKPIPHPGDILLPIPARNSRRKQRQGQGQGQLGQMMEEEQHEEEEEEEDEDEYDDEDYDDDDDDDDDLDGDGYKET